MPESLSTNNSIDVWWEAMVPGTCKQGRHAPYAFEDEYGNVSECPGCRYDALVRRLEVAEIALRGIDWDNVHTHYPYSPCPACQAYKEWLSLVEL